MSVRIQIQHADAEHPHGGAPFHFGPPCSSVDEAQPFVDQARAAFPGDEYDISLVRLVVDASGDTATWVAETLPGEA